MPTDRTKDRSKRDQFPKRFRAIQGLPQNHPAGKTCPSGILDALTAFNAEGRPIWKPMHMQPIYRSNAYIDEGEIADNGKMVYGRGLCLPSDNKMTPEQQDKVIEVIKRCFE